MQTNPITQPQVRYIHMAIHMRPARYTALAVRSPLSKKEICPFLTGNINPQSSHWNNEKMKLAYNSATSRQKLSNLPSPGKPLLCISISVPTTDVVIVNFITSARVIARDLSCSYNLLRRSQDIGNAVTFLHISFKPQHRPRTWLYPRKANELPIPTMYSAYRNIVNFSRKSRIHFR